MCQHEKLHIVEVNIVTIQNTDRAFDKECPRWKIESPFNHPSMVFHFAVDGKLDLIGRRMYYLSLNDAHLQYIRIYPRQVYCMQ